MSLPIRSNASAAHFMKVLYSLLRSSFIIVFCLLLVVISFNSSHASVLEKSITDKSEFQASDLYQALSAEIYNKLGDQDVAVDVYYELSSINSDPAIAKRVTELATVSGQLSKALNGAMRWVELQPESLEANQYLALLYIRNSRFNSAATQIDKIRLLIESTSPKENAALVVSSSSKGNFNSNESLAFIGAMLAVESHHEKAYTAYDLFIKNHYSKHKNHKLYKTQLKLISAQLAMKAKKYKVVTEKLTALHDLDTANYIDTKVMLAKALHKLKNNKDAITHLEAIQTYPEAKDSHRLELVRLLVLDKQKDKAIFILEKLVKKHPKNFELLKSFVALQLDQSKLINVKENIERLGDQENYVNEAHYFSGEYSEKLGQREKALASFEKVEKGAYLKNAHKKTISLTRVIHGEKGIDSLFKQRQDNAESIDKQAYWIKLQADDSLEYRQYDRALALYNKAIKLAPENNSYLYKRGLANERLGNYKEAELDFASVLKKRKNHVDALNSLGFMLAEHTQRLIEAKNYIDRAYKLKPNDPLVLDSLGFVLYRTGDLDNAEIYLRKAFALMQRPQVASHLIKVLVKLKRIEEAKNILLKMQKRYPRSPSLKSVSRYFL